MVDAGGGVVIDRENVEDLKKKSRKERREAISKIRYVLTRNKFTHGDLFYLRLSLSNLIPFNKEELIDYGIEDKEWWNPSFETVAYVHLSKTLRFMKAFTDLLIEKQIERA